MPSINFHVPYSFGGAIAITSRLCGSNNTRIEHVGPHFYITFLKSRSAITYSPEEVTATFKYCPTVTTRDGCLPVSLQHQRFCTYEHQPRLLTIHERTKIRGHCMDRLISRMAVSPLALSKFLRNVCRSYGVISLYCATKHAVRGLYPCSDVASVPLKVPLSQPFLSA